MNADGRGNDEERINGITAKVIGAAYRVGGVLGAGFLEKVYENALAYEVRKQGLTVEQQKPIAVRYDGVVVGDYAADLTVEGCVLVELKATKATDDIHRAQCINYLKATGLKVCLLINFGKPKVELQRIVLGL